eukprot:3931206-Pleurochrysis_carterae.AAC.1
MPTTDTRAHRYPLLAADASIHWMDAQVMSRVASNSRSCGRPISPPRSSRLWASNAAAHSTTPLGEL